MPKYRIPLEWRMTALSSEILAKNKSEAIEILEQALRTYGNWTTTDLVGEEMVIDSMRVAVRWPNDVVEVIDETREEKF